MLNVTGDHLEGSAMAVEIATDGPCCTNQRISIKHSTFRERSYPRMVQQGPDVLVAVAVVVEVTVTWHGLCLSKAHDSAFATMQCRQGLKALTLPWFGAKLRLDGPSIGRPGNSVVFTMPLRNQPWHIDFAQDKSFKGPQCVTFFLVIG